MTNFFRLLRFELDRFFKLYIVLIVVTIVSQLAGLVIISKLYMRRAREEIVVNQNSMESFLETYGQFSLANLTHSLWFVGPIALCIVSLLIYVFFIWYRDWFGKNTFIYRLLMLPTERLNVYLAKAMTIFTMVLGLVSLQIVLIYLEMNLVRLLVPRDFRLDLPIQEVIHSFDYFNILIPNSFLGFLISYGTGLMAVFVLFTAILIERSYRLKGVFIGGLYVAASFFVFISPLLLSEIFLPRFFYPIEMFLLEVFAGLIVMTGAIWLGHYLLNKKIRV